VHVPNTLAYVGVYVVLYAETKLFLGMFKIYQRMRVYRIKVTHTLTIRTVYARLTLNMLKVRYSYVMNTLLIRQNQLNKNQTWAVGKLDTCAMHTIVVEALVGPVGVT